MHTDDPLVFLHGELQVYVAWALLPLQEHMRGWTGGESTCLFFPWVFFFFVGFFFFFYFKFCQSSPVFGELRPLVHFDGELLMVSFCCKDVSFLRGGAQAEIVMWVGHIIGLQGKHAVRCWCRHIVGRALEKRQSPSLTSGIHVRRDDLPDGWHWDKWHSHCFFYFIFFTYILTMSVFVETVFWILST